MRWKEAKQEQAVASKHVVRLSTVLRSHITEGGEKGPRTTVIESYIIGACHVVTDLSEVPLIMYSHRSCLRDPKDERRHDS